MTFDPKETSSLADWLMDYYNNGGPIDYKEAATQLRAAKDRIAELEALLAENGFTNAKLLYHMERAKKAEKVVEAAKMWRANPHSSTQAALAEAVEEYDS